jgi:hypothetical protein
MRTKRVEFTAAEAAAIATWAAARGWNSACWGGSDGHQVAELMPPGLEPAFIVEPEEDGVEVRCCADHAEFHFGTVEAALAAVKATRGQWRLAV